MEELLEIAYKRIEGWLSPKEAECLYQIAATPTSLERNIVEIGSWKGKSTVLFGSVLKQMGAGLEATKSHLGGDEISLSSFRARPLGKVYAIDPHTGSPEHGQVWTYPEFEKNIKEAGLEEFVTPIIKTSQEAAKGWNKPIQLLWIDGNHEYSNVKEDFNLFSGHVIPGGMVAFHDALSSPGVGQVIKKIFFPSKEFRHFRFIENIVCAEKTTQITFIERLENFYTLNLWQFYGIYSLLYSKGIFRLPHWVKTIFKFLWRAKA